MGRFSALLGLPACPSPGHLASARFLELPASVRTSPYYSSPYLLSGSGLTFLAWASSYSTSCQMPRMYLLLAMLPLAHIESSVTSHYHAVATSSLYESSSNSGAPPPHEYPKVNTLFCHWQDTLGMCVRCTGLEFWMACTQRIKQQLALIKCLFYAGNSAAAAKSLQLGPTLCDLMDCSLPGSSPWDFPGRSTGVGCHCLLCWELG